MGCLEAVEAAGSAKNAKGIEEQVSSISSWEWTIPASFVL